MTAAASSATPKRRVRQGSGVLDRATFLRPIAHRGLHSRAKGRIENTAPAFDAAIAKGYGIECDLQAAKDGTPMVFHDDKLERLTGEPGRISFLTPAALKRLRYKGQDERMLTFADFLDLVGGRVPMLVEVKTNSATPLDPLPRQDRPPGARLQRPYRADVVRSRRGGGAGQVGPDHSTRARDGQPPAPGAAVGDAGGGRPRHHRAPARPAPAGSAFLAIDVRLLRATRAWMTRRALDLPLYSWTIRSRRERATAARYADAPIFETYEP